MASHAYARSVARKWLARFVKSAAFRDLPADCKQHAWPIVMLFTDCMARVFNDTPLKWREVNVHACATRFIPDNLEDKNAPVELIVPVLKAFFTFLGRGTIPHERARALVDGLMGNFPVAPARGAASRAAPRATRARRAGRPKASPSSKPRCGLCGKRGKVVRTDCCGQWICDDEHKYVLFSYARNSCHRNHDRYTLCAFHHAEEHDGAWQDCEDCRAAFNTEFYVWLGTNEYNFEKLPDPPAYEPTRCCKCNRVIDLGEDGYSIHRGSYYCLGCSDIPHGLLS